MNIYESIMSSKFRVLGAIILILAFRKELLVEGIIARIFILMILIFEVFFLFAKDSWWTSFKYILVWAIILTAFCCLYYGFHINVIEMLAPLVWLMGLMESKYSKLSISLAVITTLFVIVMSVALDLSVQIIFSLMGIYLGVRSIRIRQDAYRTSQLHLKELNLSLLELQEAHEKLQEASIYSMRYAALEERTRIAREIHDGIGHQLTTLIVQLQALEFMMQKEPEKAKTSIRQILEVARKAMAEVRLAVKEWSDDEMGLGLVSLRGLVTQIQDQTRIKFNVYQDSEVSEWSLEISVVLYRILQEALTNILRHSNATIVNVKIKESDGMVCLTVKDNGEVSDKMQFKPGFGMIGMMERAKGLGGICIINPISKQGLCIEVKIPLNPN